MQQIVLRLVSATVLIASVAACTSNSRPTSVAPSGPAGVPSSSDVNPISGARGGTNGR